MAAAMRIYHAGDLFDFKHLSGNRLLSDAVQKVSHGFYQTILPPVSGTVIWNWS